MSYTKAITYRGTKEEASSYGTGIKVTRSKIGFSPVPSQTIRNHSPDGFNWGYGGSGPAQLALALLLDACSDRGLAERYHQQFKTDVVCKFGDKWEFTDEQVRDWVKDHNQSEEVA